MESLHILREREYALAGLFPYDYAFYRRLGWETASTGCKYSTLPELLPALAEAQRTSSGAVCDFTGGDSVQPAQPCHLNGMAQVYENSAREQALWAARDAKRWQYLQDRVANKYVSLDSAETVTGYLLYDIQPGSVQLGPAQREQPPLLNILELCAGTPRARRALLSHLAAQRQVGRIQYVTTPGHLQTLQLLPGYCPPHADAPFAHIEAVPALMLRVVDFSRLLQILRVNWNGMEGEMLLTMRASEFARMSVSVLVMGNRAGLPDIQPVTVTSNLNDDAIQAQTIGKGTLPKMRVEGDAWVWSQVIVGHIGGEDACAYGKLVASMPEAARLAGWLFPARSPFLPAPDHF